MTFAALCSLTNLTTSVSIYFTCLQGFFSKISQAGADQRERFAGGSYIAHNMLFGGYGGSFSL